MTQELKTVLQRNIFAAFRKGDYDEAAQLLDRLKLEDPLSVETRGLELEYLVRSGRLREAESLAKQLLELFPASARVLYLAGQLAYRRKDYAVAERHLHESLSVYSHWRAAHLRGKTLTQMGRLEEAESVLLPIAREHPQAKLDLAWLYERKGEHLRALREVEAYLEERPDDEFALDQRHRLRARVMSPDELLKDVDDLREHGEEVPEPILPQYVDALLRKGQSSKARETVNRLEGQLPPRVASSVGWTCYKLCAYDLAVRMFLIAFPRERGNVKFLTALEKAAERCGRVGDLVKLYEAHAGEERRLYGRLRELKRRG